MKKIITSSFLLFSTLSFCQTTFFSENFGSGSASSIIAYYNGAPPSTFQNIFPIVYDGNGQIKNAPGGQGTEGNTFLPSNIVNSSGGSFLWMYSNGNIFDIQGINTTLYIGCKLSFNIRLGVTNQSRRNLKLEQSIDGIIFTEIILPTLPPNQWVNLELNDILLSSNNLRLRFNGVDMNGFQGSISIDDIKLTYSSLSTNQNTLSELNIYPNPVINILNVKVDSNLNHQPYTIIDGLGRVVLNGNINDVDTIINVEQLSKGIYYLKVSNNSASKFVKE